MKAARFFSATDTYGRNVELAQSETGEWYSREYGFNGYGKGWTRWESSDAPAFETHGENNYTGERFEYEVPQAFWGFNKMREHDDMPRVRLPNA